jgi:hypothetical protein
VWLIATLYSVKRRRYARFERAVANDLRAILHEAGGLTAGEVMRRVAECCWHSAALGLSEVILRRLVSNQRISDPVALGVHKGRSTVFHGIRMASIVSLFTSGFTFKNPAARLIDNTADARFR